MSAEVVQCVNRILTSDMIYYPRQSSGDLGVVLQTEASSNAPWLITTCSLFTIICDFDQYILWILSSKPIVKNGHSIFKLLTRWFPPSCQYWNKYWKVSRQSVEARSPTSPIYENCQDIDRINFPYFAFLVSSTSTCIPSFCKIWLTKRYPFKQDVIRHIYMTYILCIDKQTSVFMFTLKVVPHM